MASTGITVSKAERQALCALLEDRGPLAPTLCDGWATSDLAAHLFVRESRPWVGIGILVPALSSITEGAMESAKRSLGYEGLIRRVRSGPPAIMRPLDGQVNTVEFFVHHEDVRRAGEKGGQVGSREDARLDAALWANLKRGGRLMARKLKGAGLELSAPGHGSISVRSGTPVVTVTGSPQELMLFMFGRKKVAKVELDGPEEARRAVSEASFGL